METIIKVDGIKCSACVKAIKDGLMNIPSIKDVTIDIENKTVKITSDTKIPEGIVKQKIENLGFDIIQQ